MGDVDLNTVRDLVLDSAGSFKEAVDIEDVDVVERTDPDGSSTLLIRLRADSHQTHRRWTETRLRISQRIRDELLRIGDLRYPILSVFSEREWLDRDR